MKQPGNEIMKQWRILAIETSCDETAAAVIAASSSLMAGRKLFDKSDDLNVDRPVILSNIVSSQVDLHTKTGGVVPEVASRAHVEAIMPVIIEALMKASEQEDKNACLPADSLKDEITHIAVTAGPGLIGSLLVGFNAAKTLAYALDKPIIPINHIEGHIYSALAEQILIRQPADKFQMTNKTQIPNTRYQIRQFDFPLLALIVSGGHTSLILMRDHGRYKTIGQTLDDAAGEAFDKVAKLLGLGYPGGPLISKITGNFQEKREVKCSSATKSVSSGGNVGGKTLDETDLVAASDLRFPRPLIDRPNFDFSFSGLKTAVLYEVKRRSKISNQDKVEIAAAFEEAVVDVLVTKTMRAVLKFKPKTVVLAGGVAANIHLRNFLTQQLATNCKLTTKVPPIELCGDNAAMIGLAAYYHIFKSNLSSWRDVKVNSNWELN